MQQVRFPMRAGCENSVGLLSAASIQRPLDKALTCNCFDGHLCQAYCLVHKLIQLFETQTVTIPPAVQDTLSGFH